MSRYGIVFWRGAFALALLPVSIGLVAANGAAPAEDRPSWTYEFSDADAGDRAVEQQRVAARQIAAARVQVLRVVAATARAKQQESRAKFSTVVELERALPAQPSG